MKQAGAKKRHLQLRKHISAHVYLFHTPDQPLLPVSMAAMMTTSLTQSNSQEASRVLAIWGSRGNSDMMMPISDRLPSLSKAAR